MEELFWVLFWLWLALNSSEDGIQKQIQKNKVLLPLETFLICGLESDSGAEKQLVFQAKDSFIII